MIYILVMVNFYLCDTRIKKKEEKDEHDRIVDNPPMYSK